MISILHICDLHRDPTHPITNKALLNSLQSDLQRYTQSEETKIKVPDIIIVSGDLVQGVKVELSKDLIEELNKQYEEAEKFLNELTTIFLRGDKNKIIIVPGNHDISSYHFIESLKKLNINREDLQIKKIVHQLFSPKSLLRWSWDSLEVFEIVNLDKYHQRLEPFCNFYKRFYGNYRQLDINPENQYDIFDFVQYNIAIVAFSSCFNNDLFNQEGAIHYDCIASASNTLRQWKYNNRIKLAIWHHGLSGAPSQSDYMNADILQVLIDNGFSIGFHGHQHKPQFIDERFEFGSERKITVISAGTLCGGPGSLPSGHSRSYNILEIDTENQKARLHLRKMLNNNFDSPVWGPGMFPSSLKSFVDFNVQPPLKTVSSKTQLYSALSEAERLLHDDKCEDAVKILKPLASEYEMARRLLLECYVKTDDIVSIIEHFDPPRSIMEIVHLADALWEKKELKRLKSLLSSEIVTSCSDPSVDEVVKKYAGRVDK